MGSCSVDMIGCIWARKLSKFIMHHGEQDLHEKFVFKLYYAISFLRENFFIPISLLMILYTDFNNNCCDIIQYSFSEGEDYRIHNQKCLWLSAVLRHFN